MERLARDKHFSLLPTFVNYRCKIFNNIGPKLSDVWPIGLLLKTQYNLWRKMVTFWAALFRRNFIYIFTQISSFKKGIFLFHKGFDIDALGFKLELWCRYFVIFWLWKCLGYFFQLLGEYCTRQSVFCTIKLLWW